MGKSTKHYSNIQEKRLAKNLNGKKQIGSGAVNLTSLKGDVSVTDFLSYLVEAKTKVIESYEESKRSITFKKEWLKEVQTHAFNQGKNMGVVAFSFDNIEDFFALSKVDFENLVNTVNDQNRTIQVQNLRIEFLLKLVSNLMAGESEVKVDNFTFEKTAPKEINTYYNEEDDTLSIIRTNNVYSSK